MINNKVLSRQLLFVEYIPSAVTCLLVAILFIAANIHYQKDHRSEQFAYLTSLFSHHIPDIASFQSHSDSLLRTESYRSLSLFNGEQQLVAHFGQPLLDKNLHNSNFNKAFWRENGIDHYLFPIHNPSLSGHWVLATSKSNQLELWVYRSILLLLTALLISSGVIYFSGRNFRANIREESQTMDRALVDLAKHNCCEPLPESQNQVFSPLAKHINTLSNTMTQSMKKMQQTIDQSVKDLEETLETVEIQNIEIDLARKNAIKANQAKSEFLASTSHEIRTPLNGILGFTNLMRKTELSAVQEEYLETIEDSAQILLLNINDIIDFSRLEIGKLNLEYKPIYLADLIKESQKYIMTHANAGDTELAVREKTAIPNKLLGDPLRFKQVYTNLLSNALTLCHSSKITTTLAIHNNEENQSHLRVELLCPGDKIETRDLQTAQALLRARDPAHEKLTSKHHMGLVIAKGLVERMNGDVGITINDGETVFWFSVSLGRPNQEIVSRPTHSKTKVLVVDDNQSNRKLIEEFLSDMQINVQSAGSGEEAIAMCEKEPFDLVLMDIQMPGLNGFETTQRIREIEKGKQRTPIVALTAHAVEEAKAQLLLSGLDDFVSKPIGETELRELLNRWVEYTNEQDTYEEVDEPLQPNKSLAGREQPHTTNNAHAPQTSAAPPKENTEQASSGAVNTMPVDICLSLELTKNKADLAHSMLDMLIKSIAEELTKMKTLWEAKQYDELQNIVHQIHGGACYCGVPELLNSSKALDQALKDQKGEHSEVLYLDFVFACERLLAWEQEHDLATIFDVTPA